MAEEDENSLATGSSNDAEERSASDLKALGNAAYQSLDIAQAVDLWNLAIQKHVESLQPQVCAQAPLDTSGLERSLYLNLAQGYLKLGDPGKALRACQIVAHDHRSDVKARYRAAEACLALKQFDDAVDWLNRLLEIQEDHPEAKRLLQKVRLAERAEAKRQKDIARRMCAGATGFSDGRDDAATAMPAGVRAAMQGLDGSAVALGTNVAEAAAQAALRREERRNKEAAPSLPEPTVTDLDAFKAKCLGRSKKYNSFADRSRKQKGAAEQSVRLQWLRSGEDRAAFNDFVSPLQRELRSIEEQDRVIAAAAHAEDDEQQEEDTSADVEQQGQCTMEEMD